MTIVCALFLIPAVSSERNAGEAQEHGAGEDGTDHVIQSATQVA